MTRRVTYSRRLLRGAWGVALAVLLMSVSTEALAQLTFYQERETFNEDFPGLPLEDFEETLVGRGQQQVCPGPFDSQTDDACFAPGGILEGIGLDVIQQQGDGQMLVLTDGIFGLNSNVVGPNNPFDDLEIVFFKDDVFAVGLDLLSPITGPFTPLIQIFGPGEDNLLGETEMTTGGTQGVFWGVSSDNEPITRIVIQGDGDSILGVDNIAFGDQQRQLIIEDIVPGGVPVLAPGEEITFTVTVVDEQKNPVAGAQLVVNDELLNVVITVGNTDNQGRFDYQAVVPENAPNGFYALTFIARRADFIDSEPVGRQVEVQRQKLVIQNVTPSSIPTLGLGETATYAVTVVDLNNEPVPGAQIRVDDGLLEVVITVGTTDDQGQITYETVVPENKPEGFFILSFVAQKEGFDDSDPVERQVEVQRREPGLTVTPGTLAFGRVPLGESEARPATLSNTGTGPLTVQAIRITGADAGDFSLPSLNIPLVIAAGGSTTFNVRFAPSARGVRNANLEVDSDGGNTSNPLVGEGAAPGISVEPTSLDYGQVDVGAFANGTLTITNTGNNNLSIETVRIVGPNAQAFTITGGGGARVLGIGAQVQVIVRFTPLDIGTQNATLEILSNAVDDAGNSLAVVSVPLVGGGAIEALEVAPEMIDFGVFLVGTPSGEQTVTANNTGNVELNLQIRIVGNDADAFSIVRGGSGGFLNPGDPPREIVLQYTATRSGPQTAELQIQWNSATTFVALSGSGVEVILPPPQPSGPAEVGQALAVRVGVPEGFTPTSQQLFFRRGGEAAYQQVDLTGAADGGLEGAIPAEFVTERGLEYYVRLSDDDVAVTFPESNPEANPVVQRVEIPLIDAGGVFQPGVYRMISAPLEVVVTTIQLRDDYGPFDPTQWRALQWDARLGRYVEAGSGELIDEEGIQPGLSAWLITRSGDGFDVENGRSTDTSGPFTLDVPEGEHQIGNPFAFPVAVSSIANIGSLQGPFFYDGTEYLLGQTVLMPWEGYFFINASGEEVTISVPPVETVAAPKQGQQADLFPDADFMLQLRAELPALRLRDTQNFLGFAEEATARPHAFNLGEPPPIGNHLRLSIVEGERRYVSYFKPASEEGQRWDLDVTTVLEGVRGFEAQIVEVALVEHGPRPERFDFYIFDRDFGRVLPVEGGVFRVDLTRSHPVRHLSVILGTTAFAEAHSEGASLTPVAFFLDQNYPNPFNPETVIRYGLDQQSPVVLTIYDMLGRRVRTLVEAEQTSGRHEAVWDGLDDAGRPAASGLYVYQLRAGAFIASRKMLLLR